MSITSRQLDDEIDAGQLGRYEFRAWCPLDAAYEMLDRLADRTHDERLDDWYLPTGRQDCNAKIRGERLKIKRLLGEEQGFQRWASSRRRIVGDGIDPIDVVTRELGLIALPARPGHGSGPPSPVPGLEAVHVRKWRQCFGLGAVEAEAVEMTVGSRSERLTSVAIEGDDLDELVDLRLALGLESRRNIAVHLAIDRL